MNRATVGVFFAAVFSLCLACSGWGAEPQSAASLQHYAREAQAALAAKHYDEAAAAYEKLIQLDPGVGEAYSNLGLVYFQQRKYEEAVAAFEHALRLKPGLTNAEYFLAMSLSELGQYQKALPVLEEGFKSARNPEMRRLLGLHLERTYTGLGRNGEAVSVAVELTRVYPNDPEVLYETGRLCGNFAYLAMQRLGTVAPESKWRHLAAGNLFESQGDYALAIREYGRVLALDPSQIGVHYRLGRALLRSKQPGAQAEALKEFQGELELDPTNASAAYEAGEIYRKLGQLSKARMLLEQALKYYPDLEEAQVEMGRVLIAEKQPALAVTYLERAVSQNPGDEAAYFQLARAYQQLGNTAGQRKALAEFARLQAKRTQQQSQLQVGAYLHQAAGKNKPDSKGP